jgi:hypothetical protein
MRATHIRHLEEYVFCRQRKVCSHDVDDASQCRKGSFFPFLDDIISRCRGFCLNNGVNGGCSHHTFYLLDGGKKRCIHYSASCGRPKRTWAYKKNLLFQAIVNGQHMAGTNKEVIGEVSKRYNANLGGPKLVVLSFF